MGDENKIQVDQITFYGTDGEKLCDYVVGESISDNKGELTTIEEMYLESSVQGVTLVLTAYLRTARGMFCRFHTGNVSFFKAFPQKGEESDR